ncbi:MAG TPA: pitrilysin family protein [Chitinivibrionales bacterium]|jgi:predicted Zn-dependent peptidase|nr:pitrilysin family protein [Chitinivibrionales bacterium]
MRRFRISLVAVALASLAASAYDINVPVTYDTLKNGLRIIVVPDTNVAVVSCRLYYFVGSMYEQFSRSGLSHMYEHMMFKGTHRLNTADFTKESVWLAKIDSVDKIIYAMKNRGIPDTAASCVRLRAEILGYIEKERAYIKKDEIWKLYMDNGGTHLNAWTGDDMTAYIVTLPKNKVELFYWIESDRMANPVFREFYSERDVVLEERRMRWENQPTNRFYEYLNSLFYLAHPYRLPTIGWKSDIENYTIQDLARHVKQYYTPDNAVLVLVGNIAPAKAITDIKRYFGGIPRAAAPKQEVVTREPATIGETRFTVRDDATPQIDIMFHTPGYDNEDLYKLDVLESILSGRSGRLYDRLVNREDICTSAEASNAFKLHDGYFELAATLKKDTDPARVEKIIREEIASLAARPPSPREMQRIKNSIRMSFVSNLRSLEGLSDRLAWFERLGSWKAMLSYPDRIDAVRPEDVPAIVRKYFDFDKATVGVLLQKQ